MLDEVFSQLAEPSAQLRGAPFWAWNSKLEPAELRRQIRIFKQMGLGGFFMHSRVGMATPYLSKKWFECIDACVDEAKKQGMYAWLYDEDRWPSGTAGGLVTKNPQFRLCFLRIVIADDAAGLVCDDGQRIGNYYCAKFSGDISKRLDCTELKKLDKLPTKAPKGSKLIAFYVTHQRPSSWFNGQTYVDTLNKDAIAEFIKDTHEVYLKNCGDEFGKCIPGIFSDEPYYIEWDSCQLGGRPWSLHFVEEFKKRCGYDITDFLPEIFLNIKGIEFSSVAYDYYNVSIAMFTEAYAQQIGQWCEKHGLEYTGHAAMEETMWTQRECFGDAMRFYEFEQRPGIDLLMDRNDIIDVAKQCSSVAHQLDRPNRLCEAYGCTGWDFPFSGHKAWGDWLQVLGINFRVQHLAWYSMRGEAKRDYPASISFQSSWWPYYKVVEDYFARQRAVLDPAKEIREILVIHPLESLWGEKLSMTQEESKAYCNEHMIALRNELLWSHNDFDYGCEEMLPRYTTITKALKGEDGAPVRLQVGVARYSTVILPKMSTIRATTLKLLEDFVAAGGAVYYIAGGVPGYVDGRKNAEVATRYRKSFRSLKLSDIAKEFSKTINRISLTAVGDREDPNCRAMLYMVREAGDYQALFLVNTSMYHDDINQNCPATKDRKISYAKVEVQWQKHDDFKYIYEIDQMSGKLHQVKLDRKKKIVTSFAPLQSRLYIACATEQPEVLPAMTEPTVMEDFELDPCCHYTLSEKNSMVLDHAAYTAKCSDGRQVVCEDATYIIRIDDNLRQLLHHEPRGGMMVQPWLTANNLPPKDYIDLELRYSFDCEVLPKSALELVMENPHLFKIEVNGTEISNKPIGEWFDPCLQCLAIPAKCLVVGFNTIVLRGVYNVAQSGLEAMFLRGDFGVRGMRTMTALPNELAIGDWCEQGLPNYSGDVTYHYDLKLNKAEVNDKFAVRIPNFGGVTVGVSLNGSPTQIIMSEPYEFALDALKLGENKLDITIFGSRRNLCGPFYYRNRWPWWTGPWELKCYEVAERHLVPSGLLDAPIIEVVK